MRRVRIVESLKYGGRMFAYWLSVVVLGGGGIALGAAVGWNSVSIRGTGGDPVVYSAPELIAGIVLVSLGGTVLFTGLFGWTYKLLADSTAKGLSNGGGPGAGDVVDAGPAAGESEPVVSDATPAQSQPEPAAQPASESAGTGGPAAAGTGEANAAASQPADATGQKAEARAEQPPSEPATGAPMDQEAAGGKPGPSTSPARNARPAGTATGDTAPSGEGAGEPAEPPAATEGNVEPDESPEEAGTTGAASLDDDGRERTAEQIAFGAEGGDERPAEDQRDRETTGADDPLPEDESPEPGDDGPADGGAGADSADQDDERPAIFTDDRAEMAGDSLDEDADVETGLSDDEAQDADIEAEFSDDDAEDADDEGTVIPEYDEISGEDEESSESNADDPLGSPFE
ncbi:hypothetical protein BRC87_00675 [Halobacteriales archaeon QS_4_66_20]|nr:MAG: hypothetical protein BRC87_00675 [Halobacteriales archaeon QS_4_66_20]